MPALSPAGDAAALLSFGDEMSLGVMARCHSLVSAVEHQRVPGLLATVVGRSSVLIYFDSLQLAFDDVELLVRRLVGEGIQVRQVQGRSRHIPTLYGGAYGPDLSYVSEYHQISEDDVVSLQTDATYVVSSLGFAPGLPVMMGLPPQLALPRKPSPRPAASGSVLIASQVVVYPLPNPSGWWCIGRTALKLFDPQADSPSYLLPGDQVRFSRVTEDEYLRMGGERTE